MADVLRIDVSLDGEPIGSIEAHQERIGGRDRIRVTMGDTTGEISEPYTHRRLKRLPKLGDEYAMFSALNIAQSAMAKRWWCRNGRWER